MARWRLQRRWSVLGGIVLILTVAAVVERYRGLITLRAWEREVRGRGGKVTLQDLAPVATNRKAGFISGVEAGMLLANVSLGTSVPQPMRQVRAGRAKVVSREDLWVDWQDRTNSWDYLRSLTGQIEPHLEALRTNLVEANVALVVDYTNAWRSFFPALLQPGRAAGQTLAAEALLAIHDHDPELALRRLALLEGVDRALRDQPLVMFQWLRSIVGNQLCGVAWEATRQDGWSDEQLARLQRLMDGLHYLEDSARAMEAERVLNGAYFDQIRSGFSGAQDLIGAMGGVRSPGSLPNGWGELVEVQASAIHHAVRVLAWRLLWSYHDQLFYSRSLQSSADALRGLASGEIDWGEATRRDETRRWERIDGVYDKLRYLVTPLIASGRRTGAAAVEIETRTHLAATAVAIRRYQLAEGGLPSALSSLVPRFLEVLPRDLFAGRPFCYRPLESGDFLLYSVGNNGEDDGGNVDGAPSDFRGLWGNQDVVWPRVATPEESPNHR